MSQELETKTDNPANQYHLCAKQVAHEQWGKGDCIPTMHGEPTEDGLVEWYDVMFEHGIETQVATEDLEILFAEGHMHASADKKKKGKQEIKAVKEEEDLDEAKYPKKSKFPSHAYLPKSVQLKGFDKNKKKGLKKSSNYKLDGTDTVKLKGFGGKKLPRGFEEVEGEEGEMPSKAQVMALCKDGKSADEICAMYPDCDQEKLKAMIDGCESGLNEDNTNDDSDDGEGLDKVQPKAVKKKFGDRKDKDIDNDGDEDESDKYLHMRRKAVSKALSKKDEE